VHCYDIKRSQEWRMTCFERDFFLFPC
jgi:hypothetical protein